VNDETASIAPPSAFIAPLSADGRRLDVFLAEAHPHHSRSRWRSLLDEGRVVVDGAVARASYKLRGGERIVVDEPATAPATLEAEDIALEILFEDAHLLVVNKPAGLVVHPGAGNPNGTLVNALLHHVPDLAVGGMERPGIVHRLDKDTSGLMVCAKNDEAQRRLSAAFKSREVDKTYLAICLGRPKETAFELITGHRRHPTDRKRYTTRLEPPDEETSGVRLAHSRFRVVMSAGGASLVEVELLTGRTHQIRAHLADRGHPLVADALYGGGDPAGRVKPGPVADALSRLTRQALHAARLAFNHPLTGEALQFEAPLPDDLAALAEAIAAAAGAGP